MSEWSGSNKFLWVNSSDTDQTIDWKLSTSNQESSELLWVALRWTIWRLCSLSQHLDNWLSFQKLIGSFIPFYIRWYVLINKLKGYIKQQSQLDCRGTELGELKLYLFYWHLHSDWANFVGTPSNNSQSWNLRWVRWFLSSWKKRFMSQWCDIVHNIPFIMTGDGINRSNKEPIQHHCSLCFISRVWSKYVCVFIISFQFIAGNFHLYCENVLLTQ